MGFTTNTFLFLFLPITIMAYYALYHYMNGRKDFTVGNICIAFVSYIFYSWALNTNAIMLLFFTIIIYVFGKLIDISGDMQLETNIYIDNDRRTKKFKVSAVFAAFGILFAIYILYHFKYIQTVAPVVAKYFYIDVNKYSNITVPVGISFITFSAISYIADIYKNEATSGSFLDCFVYMFYFPKIVSGPVVRWKDFEPQIKYHPTQTNEFVAGLNRIIVGFGKKTILADTFGAFVNSINGVQIDGITACMGWLAYALQIYYDFSGYSDIAIGLSKIFGISLYENFNFPYMSLSITEFWRRWHISLGSFFREYVYIPLGGNRKGIRRTVINLGIVFLVTGIWHGAGMAYIIWGMIHGMCVIIERMVSDKQWYHRIPKIIKWLFTFVIVASLWQLFRFGNIEQTIICFRHMMGIHSYTFIEKTWKIYATKKLVVFFIIGMVGATLLGNRKIIDCYNNMKENYLFYVLQEIILLGIMILSIAFMINSTYSPFIYFQF